MLKSSCNILAVCSLLVVSACQLQAPGDVLQLDGNKLENTKAIAAKENIGKGKVLVTMLLNGSGPQATGNDAASYRDGAALAMRDLGAQHITLSIRDVQSNVEKINDNVREAVKSNAKLLIIGAGRQLLQKTILTKAKSNFPVVSISENSFGADSKIYTFQPDGIDGLIAGIKFASAPAKKNLVLILPENQTSSGVGRIESLVSGYAELIGLVTPSKLQDSKVFLNDNKSILASADIIAFIGKDQQSVEIAGQIRSSIDKSNRKKLVGRADWPNNIWKNPAYSGIIIATPDRSSLELIKGRFQKKYSRPMKLSAAYAYDLVAIASGLIRVKGPDAISRSNLEANTGFRGATGVFRFKSDGSVERLYRILQARQGKLTMVQELPKGF